MHSDVMGMLAVDSDGEPVFSRDDIVDPERAIGSKVHADGTRRSM